VATRRIELVQRRAVNIRPVTVSDMLAVRTFTAIVLRSERPIPCDCRDGVDAYQPASKRMLGNRVSPGLAAKIMLMVG
jgi:hypothetical protein